MTKPKRGTSAKRAQPKYLKLDLDRLRTDIKPFLSNNSESELKEEDSQIFICKPWGDDTMTIPLVNKTEKIVAALNGVLLPHPLTALYHCDKKAMEFIYSPLASPDELKRTFTFAYDSNIYNCSYDKCSERLLLIAEAFQPAKPSSHTDYRNLTTFKRYLRDKDNPNSGWKKGEYVALSFWIYKIDYDESKFLRLCQHLNFYSYYFEKTAPRILIHERRESLSIKVVNRAFKTFPAEIVARPLDPYLLSVWENAIQAPDTFRKFLYFYQMLEYSAFYYIQGKVMNQLSRILVAPETASFPLLASQRVLETMIADRMTDEAKIEAVILEAVDPEVIWNEIELNLDHFTHDITFDGGFTLKALLKADAKKPEFLASWEKSIPTSLRKIRNALVHAREARMSDVISPSRGNYQKLAPWIAPLSRISMQTAISIGSEKSVC